MCDHGPGPAGTIGLCAAATVAVIALLMLTGCGERASTYDPNRGRWVDTQEYRRDQINREIDKRERDR